MSTAQQVREKATGIVWNVVEFIEGECGEDDYYRVEDGCVGRKIKADEVEVLSVATSTFEVGQHVKFVEPEYGPTGLVGIVREGDNDGFVGVEFIGWHGGHNLEGMLNRLNANGDSGYYCYPNQLEKI